MSREHDVNTPDLWIAQAVYTRCKALLVLSRILSTILTETFLSYVVHIPTFIAVRVMKDTTGREVHRTGLQKGILEFKITK